MIDKVVSTFDQAVADIPSEAMIHCGGFASPFNMPSYLIAALARQGASGLTIASTSAGTGEEIAARLAEAIAPLVEWPKDFWDLGLLADLGRIRKLITSFPVGTGRDTVWPFERRLEAGEVELELIGQGSLAERIRCARAGIAGFYTPVGPGTAVAQGKEVRDFDGLHVLEHALPADFALIRAYQADRFGNLTFRGARTFNETMAGAARVTVAEVDEVVPLGDLRPEHIHVAGVYVQRVVVRPRQPIAAWDEPC